MTLQASTILKIGVRRHMPHWILGKRKTYTQRILSSKYSADEAHHFGLHMKDSEQVDQNFLQNLFKRSLIHFGNISKGKKMRPKTSH